MKKVFHYIENLWIGPDGNPSIRRLLGIAFSIDLIINVHKNAGVLIKILNLINSNHAIDATVLSTMSSFLANIAMVIGIEAGLVTALFSLTTYQNVKAKTDDTKNSD